MLLLGNRKQWVHIGRQTIVTDVGKIMLGFFLISYLHTSCFEYLY